MKTTQSHSNVNYPTQATFKANLDELIDPTNRDVKPVIFGHETPFYLKTQSSYQNPYSGIQQKNIDDLKSVADARRNEEKQLKQSARHIGEKLPYSIRQQHMAAVRLKELIHNENLIDLTQYGRFFGPKKLIGQALSGDSIKNSRALLVKDQDENRRSLSAASPARVRLTEVAKPSSLCTASPAAITVSRIDRANTVRMAKFESIRDFIADRQRICLLQLASCTKMGEVERLKKMLEIENEYLSNEERDVIRRNEEHDQYLKVVCQRTADTIKMAEEENGKRIEVTDRIERARYKLAHLNAECVKMEEEYLRLNYYRKFLLCVAENFHETKLSPFESSQGIGSGNIPERHQDVGKVDDEEEYCEIFRSPQDLVDIYSKLESTNLTLIENALEQDEYFERLHAKSHTFVEKINRERVMVQRNIEMERQKINKLSENINGLASIQQSLSDLMQPDQFCRLFHLGDPKNLQEMMSILKTPEDPATCSTFATNTFQNPNQSSPSDKGEITISLLLNVLQVEVQKVYTTIYSCEDGAELDTLVMLKRLETTIDEYRSTLSSYPREVVLKARKTVDAKSRFQARCKQKMQEAQAHEERLKKASEKALEKPRYQLGRRVMQRSHPPDSMNQVKHRPAARKAEEDKKSLFE